MAKGVINLQKESGGTVKISPVDGIGITEVIVPESGVLVTKQYVDGKYSGFKNYIINGKKVVNQRVSTSTDNSYNQDRWYKSGVNWYQGIEGNNNLINGKVYTLSWEGVATASYYVGTASSSTINTQTFTSIANGGNFTLTISAGQNLWIKFASDATGSTFNFAQLEEGTTATPFEHRPYGLELLLCERYYEYDTWCAIKCEQLYDNRAASELQGMINFKVQKRVSPTMSNIGFTSGTYGSTIRFNEKGVIVQSTGSVVNSAVYINSYIASAEL